MLLGEEVTLRTNLPSFGRITVTRQAKQSRDVIHLLCAAPINRGTFHYGPIEVVEDLVIVPDVEVGLSAAAGLLFGQRWSRRESELTFNVSDRGIAFSLDRLAGHQMIALHYA